MSLEAERRRVYVVLIVCDCSGAAVQLRSSTQTAGSVMGGRHSRSWREWRRRCKATYAHLIPHWIRRQRFWSFQRLARTDLWGSLLSAALLDKTGGESLTIQSQHVVLNKLLMPCDAYSTSSSVDSIIANLFLSRVMIQDNNQCAIHCEQLTWICGYIHGGMVGNYWNQTEVMWLHSAQFADKEMVDSNKGPDSSKPTSISNSDCNHFHLGHRLGIFLRTHAVQNPYSMKD